MTAYLLAKWLHVVGATILFGTGIGIAFFQWMTQRSGDVRAIRIVTERTVLADWIFTTPAVVLQPLTGLALLHEAGYSLAMPWVEWSLALYVLAGACWIPVVWLQIRMRDLARGADAAGTPLPPLYWRLARTWFGLGVPAFCAVAAVTWLMVARPVG